MTYARTWSRIGFALAAAWMCLAAPARAEAPKVGDKAPNFELAQLDGSKVKLSELTGSGPVVLVVLRGFPGYQCPACSAQLGDLVTNASKLREKGAKVVLVYPGAAPGLGERAREFQGTTRMPENFVFVTDPDYAFTEAYGLRWKAANETAYPSTFVIAPDGTITYAKVSRSHGGRARAAEVLPALKG